MGDEVDQQGSIKLGLKIPPTSDLILNGTKLITYEVVSFKVVQRTLSIAFVIMIIYAQHFDPT